MSKTRIARLAIGAAGIGTGLLAVLGGAYVYLLQVATRGPVLYLSRPQGALDPGDIFFTIFDPLRARDVERAGEEFLVRLKLKDDPSRSVLEASLAASSPDEAATVRRGEAKYPLRSWELVDREDAAGVSRLQYRMYRENYSRPGYDDWSNGWLTVVREGTTCRVARYEAYY